MVNLSIFRTLSRTIPLPRLLVASLALQPLLGLANAYQFDDDCTQPQRDFLKQALDNAFGLNTIASTAFPNPSAGQATLLRWLFGPYDAYTYQSVESVINGVGNLNNGNLGRQDFKVYCTTKRLKVTTYKGKPKTFDSDIGENLSLSGIIDCVYNLAYTYNPRNILTHSQLQVCPWFLEYAMKKDPAFQDAVQRTLWGKIMSGVTRIVKKAGYTDVDVLSLIDKVLLHELTHMKGAGSTLDVGGIGGYGWKNCRKLSTVRTDVGAKRYGPEKNADSIALFASGVCHLLLNGGTMNEDGSFTNGNTKRWLDVSYPMVRARAMIGV